MTRAIAVYVGQAARTNLEVGLAHQTWGFRRLKPEYRELQPGDWIVMGALFTGPNVRVGPDVWEQGSLRRVIVGKLESTIYEADTPLWPDETDGIVYPHRVKFRVLRQLHDVSLSPDKLTPQLIEGLRKSATRGAGYIASDADEVLTQMVTGAARSRQVWWVNQGASFARAREGGYLWAPKLDQAGHSRSHWDTLAQARSGDLVVNYANGQIRALSTVEHEAFDDTRPSPLDEASWTADGRRLNVSYHDLDSPVPLTDIPVEWRIDEHGPFDTNGDVKQGYFYHISDGFFNRLTSRYPQLRLPRRAVQRLTPQALKATASADPYHLELSEELYATVIASLESGKHIILTGPPGTAKTTLAQAVGDTAERLGLCRGYLLTTATADWTTYETIGGLQPTRHNRLEFRPGHFLEAIEQDQWLLIDELNRSQFDRAFGQLFTVLSGQAVTLPYRREGRTGPLTVIPAGATAPISGADAISVSENWRIVATMNVFDKSLLFDMSYALMRRFAFIEVPSPNIKTFRRLIDRWADGVDAAGKVAKALLELRQIKDIGPAVYRDIARYAAKRVAYPGSTSGVRFQAFYSYLLPQFEGLDERDGRRLYAAVLKAAGREYDSEIRRALSEVLGLTNLPRQVPEWETTEEEEAMGGTIDEAGDVPE